MKHLVDRRRFVLAALIATAGIAGCDKPFNGIDLTGTDYGRQLSLPDADGRLRTLAEFKGSVTVVFFGYTQCPDVCPTTLAELTEVKRSLGPDGERVQGLFVTVDPERDTAEVLKAYVGNFDPTFIALRGSAEQTSATAREFKVFYSKVPGKAPGSYTMDHTAGAYVIDAQGRLRLFERYGTPADALASDLKQLLAGK